MNNSSETKDIYYVVENILNFRTNNGYNEYFLKWKDYDDSYNTWEPEENLNCSHLVENFKQKNPDLKCKLPNPIVTNHASSSDGPATSDSQSISDAGPSILVVGLSVSNPGPSTSEAGPSRGRKNTSLPLKKRPIEFNVSKDD
ncbi:heterochromatin protein 1-like isoform X2 [Melanaphis sacchari]|uniref:heterochromatin protein 1-like isoform X2 n=1 Tax=Melanaphis sacchari TaxID=742174 RepID=UPI000DC136FD|nr:heterochromatin protein 1-like isoform X2 [Melanaphis sacchari]